MKNLIFLLLLISSHGHTQIPDYSSMTKREKYYFSNVEGYIKTIQGDTILGVIRLNSNGLFFEEIKDEKVSVKYPGRLKKYKYLSKIPISEIDKFYNGTHKKFNYVKKVENKYIILNKIVEGEVSVYEKPLVNFLRTKTSANGLFSGYTTVHTEIYFENKNEELYFIGKEISGLGSFEISSGNRNEIRENFIKFFKDKIAIKELEKVKPRKSKLIEFVKKYNTEYN